MKTLVIVGALISFLNGTAQAVSPASFSEETLRQAFDQEMDAFDSESSKIEITYQGELAQAQAEYLFDYATQTWGVSEDQVELKVSETAASAEDLSVAVTSVDGPGPRRKGGKRAADHSRFRKGHHALGCPGGKCRKPLLPFLR